MTSAGLIRLKDHYLFHGSSHKMKTRQHAAFCSYWCPFSDHEESWSGQGQCHKLWGHDAELEPHADPDLTQNCLSRENILYH